MVDAVACPVNVLATARTGDPRSLRPQASAAFRPAVLASRAYGALISGATILRDEGTSTYAAGGLGGDDAQRAFGSR